MHSHFGLGERGGIGGGREGERERARGDKTVIMAEVSQIHQYIWHQIVESNEPSFHPGPFRRKVYQIF